MSLPRNVTISTHPCLKAKLSQLRAASTSPREVQALVHEIALLLAAEALKGVFSVEASETDETPLGASFSVEKLTPKRIALVPVLRSGLGMVNAFQTLLPEPVPVHHLGIFREKTTLQPVEYYNNLPTRISPSTNSQQGNSCDIAIIVDPVIATGGTAEAAIQTLREWGVGKIVVCSILGSYQGINRVAVESGGEGLELYVGQVDPKVEQSGMILPGVGDIGDRLFLTAGK